MEDELLYSIVARYRERLGMRGSKALILELFDRQSSIAATDLPIFSGFLDAYQEGGLPFEVIRRDHTLFPYFASFLFRKQRANFERDYGRSPTFHPFTRIEADVATPGATLLFCPECVAEDMQREGQAAWRRVHQLAGVVVCPWHDTVLRRSMSPIWTTRLEPCPCQPGAGTPLDVPTPGRLAIQFAAMNLDLLRNIRPFLDGAALAERIKLMAQADGWRPTKGSKKVSTSLAKHVIQELRPAAWSWGARDETDMERMLFATWRPDTAKHDGVVPVAYVAMLCVLGRTLDDLYSPSADLGSPTNMRAEPDEVSRLAGHRFEARLTWHRTRYEAFSRAYPEANRRLRYQSVGASVKFLRKHDLAWIDARFPPSQARGKWLGRDAVIAAEVTKHASELLAAPGPPRQLTRERLLAKIREQTPVPVSLKALPQTRKAVATCAETSRHAANRAILWQAREIVRTGDDRALRILLKSRDSSNFFRQFIKAVILAVERARAFPDPGAAFEEALVQIPRPI